MSNRNEIVVEFFCPSCAIGVAETETECPECGGEIASQEFTRSELELATLQHEAFTERERKKMADCDGSWDY